MATQLQIEGNDAPVSPTVNIDRLAAEKNMKWQVITVTVNRQGEHIKINDLAAVTNTRIRGIILTTATEVAYKNLKRGYMDLTIDQQEVFPQDFDTQLILKLDECTLKQCMLACDFRADGSQITGNYYDRTPDAEVTQQTPFVPYSFKINLYCESKSQKKS